MSTIYIDKVPFEINVIPDYEQGVDLVFLQETCKPFILHLRQFGDDSLMLAFDKQFEKIVSIKLGTTSGAIDGPIDEINVSPERFNDFKGNFKKYCVLDSCFGSFDINNIHISALAKSKKIVISLEIMGDGPPGWAYPYKKTILVSI